jgi:transmembrane sensor
MNLQPGERMVYDKANTTMTKDKVDVERFSSWVNGYLIFENEPTDQVFRKLERYYNQKIVADNGLDKITFSGKLDLKEDLGQVLDNIAFASALKVTKEEETYTIKNNAYER